MSEYTQQAEKFLSDNGLRLRATFKGDKAPPWSEGRDHGDRYLVTISRKGAPGRLTFSFWDSIAARDSGEEPTAYDVLACISGDAYCPDTFEDFCGDYGYDTDSRKAYQQWKRCAKFAERMRAFFSAAELEQLAEIR